MTSNSDCSALVSVYEIKKKNVSKIKQSSLLWHFFKISKLVSMVSRSFPCSSFSSFLYHLYHLSVFFIDHAAILPYCFYANILEFSSVSRSIVFVKAHAKILLHNLTITVERSNIVVFNVNFYNSIVSWARVWRNRKTSQIAGMKCNCFLWSYNWV